jgi:monoamine oxidase
MNTNRRTFLRRLGAAGGYGATYSAMVSLGLMATPACAQPKLTPQTGRGKSVVILGGGIAGLTTAYELERAGFKVTLLEARDRVGGRNWTLRNGSKIEMVGEADQTVSFSKGVYMNAGPARLPSHHTGVLGYCEKLGVELEVEVNSNRNAFFWGAKSNGGKPIEMRQGVNDTRGYVSELLAKAVSKGALDQDLTAEDREKLLPFLKRYGDLDEKMQFKGTERSGVSVRPGAADQFVVPRKPMPLKELLANDQLGSTIFEDQFDMQATMFQPVGGMDQIAMGFRRAIKSPIVMGAEIVEISDGDAGVSVVYRDRATGAMKTIAADYSICTLPLNILAKVKTNFAPDVRKAISSVAYDYSNKIGFETPRFWEAQQIHGGISWVGGETSLIWYPSGPQKMPTSVLLACYGSGAMAKGFAARPIAEQIAMARAAVGHIHPGHEPDLTRPAVINWSKIPYNLGPWPAYGGRGGQEGHMDDPAYVLLNKAPKGRVFFAGAHLSQTPGWQEGAVLSAWRTNAMLAERVAQTAAIEPAVRRALG